KRVEALRKSEPKNVNVRDLLPVQVERLADIFSKNTDYADKDECIRRIKVLQASGKEKYSSDDILKILKIKENEKIMINKADFFQKFLDDKIEGLDVNNLKSIEGDTLLPKKIKRDILVDYPAHNPLRKVMTITNIKDLEQPKLS